MGQQGCDLRTYGKDTFPQMPFFMFRFLAIYITNLQFYQKLKRLRLREEWDKKTFIYYHMLSDSTNINLSISVEIYK